jgi:hypothetical protein
VKWTWFTPRRPRTLNRPAKSHDGAGPRTKKTTRVGAFSVKVIRTARLRTPRFAARAGRARMPVTRARREEAPAGRRGRRPGPMEEDASGAASAAGEPEPVELDEPGEPEGRAGRGTAGTGGGGAGTVTVGTGGGGAGTVTVGTGGGGGAGGAGGSVAVVVGSGSEMVGIETVGSPFWPSACALSTPVAAPATASTAAPTDDLTLLAIIAL